MRNLSPLPASFMLLSILGFIVSGIYTASGTLPFSWGIAFSLVFALMFIASVLSVTPSHVPNQSRVKKVTPKPVISLPKKAAKKAPAKKKAKKAAAKKKAPARKKK